MKSMNYQFDFVLPDGIINSSKDGETQTDIRVLTATFSPIYVILPSNSYISVSSDENSSSPSSSTPTTGSPVTVEPLPPRRIPSPPPLPPLPTPSFTRIRPSISPFANLIETEIDENANANEVATEGRRRRRKRPNVTGNDLYKGGQLVPDVMYQATERELREYFRLINKRVICCIDKKTVQLISCFKYKKEEKQYICYTCAKHVNRDDLDDWSIGIDFTGEKLYQCNRLVHARPIWYYIDKVKENNMCTLRKTCTFCQTLIKYSK